MIELLQNPRHTAGDQNPAYLRGLRIYRETEYNTNVATEEILRATPLGAETGGPSWVTEFSVCNCIATARGPGSPGVAISLGPQGFCALLESSPLEPAEQM